MRLMIARALSSILAAELQLGISIFEWGSWSIIIDLEMRRWGCVSNHRSYYTTHTCTVRRVVYRCESTNPCANGSFRLLGNEDRNDESSRSNSEKAGDDRISGWSPYAWTKSLTGRKFASPKFDLTLYRWLKLLMKERSIVPLIYNVKESVISGGWKKIASLTWHHWRTL